MLDAILSEKAGIPAVAIITDRFRQSAKVMANTYGMPAYPFAMVPHPISNNSDAELRAKAEDAIQQCITLLRDR